MAAFRLGASLTAVGIGLPRVANSPIRKAHQIRPLLGGKFLDARLEGHGLCRYRGCQDKALADMAVRGPRHRQALQLRHV